MVIPSKGILDSGARPVDSGFKESSLCQRIEFNGFQSLDSGLQSLVGFLNLIEPYFGLQSPGFRIQEAKFSWIPKFGFSLTGRFLSKGAHLSIGIFHVEKWEDLEQKIECKTVCIFAYSSTRLKTESETLTSRFTDFFTYFEKKKADCFAI